MKKINELPTKKPLIKILSQIINSLGFKNSKAFTKDQEQQLIERLNIDHQTLSTIINSSAFIFEKAAEQSIKPNKLKSELTRSGMSEEHSDGFETVWEELGPDFIERLKQACFAPKVCIIFFSITFSLVFFFFSLFYSCVCVFIFFLIANSRKMKYVDLRNFGSFFYSL